MSWLNPQETALQPGGQTQFIDPVTSCCPHEGRVVVVLDVVVVVDVVGHGVVRGRHSRTYVSRSLSGLVPFAAVAFAESRTMAGCVPLLSGSGMATKLPQAGPSSEPGTAPADISRRVARRPGSSWRVP